MRPIGASPVTRHNRSFSSLETMACFLWLTSAVDLSDFCATIFLGRYIVNALISRRLEMNNETSKVRVALVTGGSRGVGKGIAIGLGEAGATVIVTARTRNNGDSEWPGSLDETIEAINAAGGNGIGMLCDHSDDDEVQAVFDRIARDYGRLDVPVNNVFAA